MNNLIMEERTAFSVECVDQVGGYFDMAVTAPLYLYVKLDAMMDWNIDVYPTRKMIPPVLDTPAITPFYLPPFWVDTEGNRMNDHGYLEWVYRHSVLGACRACEELIERGVSWELARMILPQSMRVCWKWVGHENQFRNVIALNDGTLEMNELMTLIQNVLEGPKIATGDTQVPDAHQTIPTE